MKNWFYDLMPIIFIIIGSKRLSILWTFNHYYHTNAHCCVAHPPVCMDLFHELETSKIIFYLSKRQKLLLDGKEIPKRYR